MASKKTKVRTAKGRKLSSTRWLYRQLNDPYVAQAKIDGYRSRAAYKLIEINQKFSIFSNAQTVIDLGASPGGWSQVVAKLLPYRKNIIAVDLKEIKPIEGINTVIGDFLEKETQEKITEFLAGEKADLILSDMAPSITGHPKTDHIRILNLCEEAYYFAKSFLKENGIFVAKIFQGGAEKELLDQLKKDFKTVKHFKPKASRKDSSEMYLVAYGFCLSIVSTD